MVVFIFKAFLLNQVTVENVQEHRLSRHSHSHISGCSEHHIHSDRTGRSRPRPHTQIHHAPDIVREAAEDAGRAGERARLLGLRLHRPHGSRRSRLAHKRDRTGRGMLGHSLLPRPLRFDRSGHLFGPRGRLHLRHNSRAASSDRPQRSHEHHAHAARQSAQLHRQLQSIPVGLVRLLSAVRGLVRASEVLRLYEWQPDRGVLSQQLQRWLCGHVPHTDDYLRGLRGALAERSACRVRVGDLHRGLVCSYQKVEVGE